MPGPEYVVVMNREEQYSIWPAHKPMPEGWTAQHRRGSREECLEYVAEVWTDMIPRTLADPDSGRAGK